MKIKKLIAEYNKKTKLCDSMIKTLKTDIKHIEKNRSKADECADLRDEQKVIKAQRQYYIQFIADLDSLLD